MFKRTIYTETAPKVVGPYSQAIQVGDLIFCSGQIPIDPKTGELVQGSIEEQTKQVMNNLQEVLRSAGATLAEVVKTTIFLADMGDYVKVNETYASFLKEPYPARSTIQVAKLPKDARIEIEMIAKIESGHDGCGCGHC